MSSSPYVTKHAKGRIRERMGLGKNGVDRVAEMALERGLRHGETKGRLSRYLDSLYLSHGVGNNMRIYSEKVFIFQGNNLITVLPLPNELKKLANICLKAKKEGGKNEED